MPEIQLNCIAVPSNLVGKITQQHVVTLKINNEESVHSLRREIKKEYTPRFDDIPIDEFVLRSIDYTGNILLSLNRGHKSDERELNPIDKISKCFSDKDISEKVIHVIVYLDIPTPSPDS